MNLKLLIISILSIVSILASCNAENNKSTLATSNKKIKIMNLTANDSTGQLMHEDEFWKIIDKSRVASGNNYQKQINALKTILLSLNPTDIEKFDNTFTALSAGSYDWKLWGAAYVINGGCSDDCFDYFRQYLIAHGKDKFYQTLEDPESCVSWIKSEEDDEWEGIQNSAYDAYLEKTGKEIPKTYIPKFELKGQPFDEGTVDQKYPKLAKKFMGY